MKRISRLIISKEKQLRSQGYSYEEIAKTLHISRSTCYYHCKNVELSMNAKNILFEKQQCARKRGRKTVQKRRQHVIDHIQQQVRKNFCAMKLTKDIAKLCCSLLYWGEGGKTLPRVQFTNSDPEMIQIFLSLLTKGFDISKEKVFLLLQLHEYHNEEEMKKFWSKTTEIPTSQFMKTYWKPHTGKIIREGYKGCVSIVYRDCQVFEELKAIWTYFSRTSCFYCSEKGENSVQYGRDRAMV